MTHLCATGPTYIFVSSRDDYQRARKDGTWAGASTTMSSSGRQCTTTSCSGRSTCWLPLPTSTRTAPGTSPLRRLKRPAGSTKYKLWSVSTHHQGGQQWQHVLVESTTGSSLWWWRRGSSGTYIRLTQRHSSHAIILHGADVLSCIVALPPIDHLCANFISYTWGLNDLSYEE